MAFDDTKTTEDGDGTVDSDEQVSADEWNAMVADQQSRVLFGTLAERPAAGDVDGGTPYLVTDLANDGGVITKVVGGSWEIQQIGDDSNRPDIVGGSADLESVSTDKINSTLEVGPDPSVSEINNVISGASPQTLIKVYGSVDYSTTPVQLADGIWLDCRQSEFRLQDSTDENSNTAIEFPTATQSARVIGADIDGNVGNQSNLGSHPDTPTAHGVLIQSGSRDCRVLWCDIQDTIRSGIVDEGERSIVRGNRVKNSGYDHLLYPSRASDSIFSDNILEGYARGGMVAVSTSDHDTSSLRLENTTVTNVETTNPFGEDTDYVVNFRQTTGDPKSNVIDGMSVDARGSGGVQLWISQPVDISGFHYLGPLTDSMPRGDGSSIIRCDRAGSEASAIEAKIVVSSTNLSDIAYGIDIWRPDITVNVDIEADYPNVRGMRINGTDTAVNTSVIGDFKTGSAPIRAVGDTNAVTFNRLNYSDPNGNGIFASGTVTLEYVDTADGTISSTTI